MFIAIASSINAAQKSILQLPKGALHQGLPPPMKPAIPLHSSSYHSVCRELAHAVAGAFQSSGRAQDMKDILGLRKFEKHSNKTGWWFQPL